MVISPETVEGVVTCVQDFVRDPSATQGSFPSDSDVAMLNIAVATADSVIVSGDYDARPVSGDRCDQQVASYTQSCLQKVVVRRKMSIDTSGGWFGAQRASFLLAGPSAARSRVRFSDNVEEGQVEYVAVSSFLPVSSRSIKNPMVDSKKKTNLATSSIARSCFTFASLVSNHGKQSFVQDHGSSSALDHDASVSRKRSGCDHRAGPVFQYGKIK